MIEWTSYLRYIEKIDILSIYAAGVSTTVAIVQITNLIRSIQKDRLRIRVSAYIKDIDVPGLIPGQEKSQKGVEYTYHHTDDGQLISRSFRDSVTGNMRFERFAYKERQALVAEILNNSDFPIFLNYVGFRLPDRTTLPIPFDAEFKHSANKMYPRHQWINYQSQSNKSINTIKAKGKAIFWIESQALYIFLSTKGIQGKIKVKPFIENSDGKPIDGKFINLLVQT